MFQKVWSHLCSPDSSLISIPLPSFRFAPLKSYLVESPFLISSYPFHARALLIYAPCKTQSIQRMPRHSWIRNLKQSALIIPLPKTIQGSWVPPQARTGSVHIKPPKLPKTKRTSLHISPGVSLPAYLLNRHSNGTCQLLSQVFAQLPCVSPLTSRATDNLTRPPLFHFGSSYFTGPSHLS